MSGNDICNECLAKQGRDYPLSKVERESLVHRWRKGGAEHFRKDCRWWPRDGTAFYQRGLDLRFTV